VQRASRRRAQSDSSSPAAEEIVARMDGIAPRLLIVEANREVRKLVVDVSSTSSRTTMRSISSTASTKRAS